MQIDVLDFVKRECKENGVKLILRKSRALKIGDGTYCGGWFDDSVPELACALGHEKSIETLLHEYCHLTQWRENCKEWSDATKNNCYDKLDRWVKGERVYNIKKYVGMIRDLELDNEKRTVSLIKQFKLDVDLSLYIKKANAYIHFYNWILISRRWWKKNNSPHNNKKLFLIMPDHFNNDYTVMSEKVKQLFEREDI